MRKCKLIVKGLGQCELFDGEAKVLEVDIGAAATRADFERQLQGLAHAAYNMGRRHEIGGGESLIPSDEERVKRAYPRAYAHTDEPPEYVVYGGAYDGVGRLGLGATEAEAWADALRGLATADEDEARADALQNAGRCSLVLQAHPDAACYFDGNGDGRYSIVFGRAGVDFIGTGATESEAWADACKRLAGGPSQ